MFAGLVLLFTLVPAIELYLILRVGSAIGAFNTFLLVIITGVFGAALAKTQGLQVLHKIQSKLERGELPAKQFLHGLLIFGGGLLLLTPGFMTDIIGLSMVFPGTRHLIVFKLRTYFESGIKNGNIKFTSFGASSGGGFYYRSSAQRPQEEARHKHINEEVEPNVFEADFKEK